MHVFSFKTIRFTSSLRNLRNLGNWYTQYADNMATRKSSFSKLFGADVDCAICLRRFKNPRALSCLHSFCEKCLENFQTEKGSASSIPCPLCQQESAIPEGGVTALTLDFRAMKLLQVLEDEEVKQDAKSCDVCGRTHTDGNQPHGYIHCSECAQTMCQQCSNTHSKMKGTQNHTVTAVPEQELMKGVEGSGAKGCKKGDVEEGHVSTFCQNHADMKLRLFCTVCNVPICDECTENDHRAEDNHEHVPIGEFASTLKERIRSQLARIDTKSQECASFISMLDTVDKSILMQEEMVNKNIKSMVEQETKRLELNVKATTNSFQQNHRQVLVKLRQKSKGVKESLGLCESKARTIMEQESTDVAIALSYKNLQPLQDSINQVTSERLDRSLLQKISESVSQQLHFHTTSCEPSLGSLVVAIRGIKNISIQSCTNGPYSMTFSKDGRLAVVAEFKGVESKPQGGTFYKLNFIKDDRAHFFVGTYYAVRQTDVKYESATQFELENRITCSYASIVSLSDLRLVLMKSNDVITLPGGKISSSLTPCSRLHSVVTDHADNIYIAGDGMVRVLRQDGALQKSINVEGLNPVRVAVCPREADVILFTHDSSKISVIDQDGKILRTITRAEWKEVAIGCDNQRLLYVLWKGSSGSRTLQRYTLDGYLLDTLFENELHGCSALILSVSPDGTAAVVTKTGEGAEVTLVSTAKKITLT